MFGFKRKVSGASPIAAAAGAPRFFMTIGGRTADSAAFDPVLNPADGSIVGYAPRATAADLDAAVAAASAAFETWGRTPDAERAGACRAIGGVLQQHAAELAALISREQGKPVKGGGFGAEFEVAGSVGWAVATADLALNEKVLVETDTHRIVQTYAPLGVVGSITPWNWPLLIGAWHIAPALRAGNTVVIKPSPNTPLSTLRAVELINQVLPPGVLNVVSGGPEIGALMSRHPGFKKIVFTGSTATGKKVMESAAGNVKRLTLELGGNDAAIVLPDADIARCAPGLFFAAFINAGQTCGAIKRLYVHRASYDALCAALTHMAQNTPMGDGLDDASVFGPVQNEAQFNKVKFLVEDAVRGGAELLTGGRPLGKGFFYPITLLGNCHNGMRIVDEEQFGPALPIIVYDDVDEAVRLANDTEFGLCASVWGEDEGRVADVAARLEAGTVYLNTHAELHPLAPFGGTKTSGLGVSFGAEGLAAYADIKVLYARKPSERSA